MYTLNDLNEQADAYDTTHSNLSDKVDPGVIASPQANNVNAYRRRSRRKGNRCPIRTLMMMMLLMLIVVSLFSMLKKK